MKQLHFFLLIIVISCQNQPDNNKYISNNNIIKGRSNNPQFCAVTLNNLRLREEPNQTGKVLATLEKNTELLDLVEWTAKEEKIAIGNKTYSSSWRKVKVKKTGQEGWVFGAGLYCYYPDNTTTDCDTTNDTGSAKEILESVLKANNLSNRYKLLCNCKPYLIEGDFNGDQKQDVAMLIRTNAKYDNKEGLIICSKENPKQKPFVIGAGINFLGGDSYGGIGLFEVISKGTTIKSNWNMKTDDWYKEGETIAPEDIVKLNTDAIHIHVAEACGGGYIYWKNGKYEWLQDE